MQSYDFIPHGGGQREHGDHLDERDKYPADLEHKETELFAAPATREQMLSLARQGAAVCAAGRPRCQLCGNPMDPEGHRCPALNGHLEQSPG